MGSSLQFEEPRIGIQLWTRWVDGPLTCIDFSPVHHWTTLGFDDGAVQLIDDQGHEACRTSIDIPIHHVRVADYKKRIITLDEHSRLVFLDLKGNKLHQQNFKHYWTSFEVKSSGIVVWGWRSPPRKLNFQGQEIRTLNVPKPWRVVRAITNEDMFFVVHNQVTLGVYKGNGAEIWSANHPVSIDLSRENPSEIAASDRGEMVAVSCFEKGVYVYDLKKRTLQHIDLDAMASKVSVSGNGRWMLLSDALGKIYLVDRNATIVWQKQLPSKVYFCKLDRNGDRALVLEESGSMTCFEFSDSKRERYEFLELRKKQDVVKPRQIWEKKVPHFEGNWTGVLKVSDDGRYFLFGIQKDFYVYNAQGNQIWNKTFMVRKDNGWISGDGETILLSNPEEVYCAHPLSDFENHLTFYKEGISDLGLDHASGRFMVFHKMGGISLYNRGGRRIWRRNLDRKVSKLRLNTGKNLAVFQGVGKTLYTLHLKSLKAGRIVLNAPVSRLRVSLSSVFAGDDEGVCYGIDFNGSIRWTHDLKQPVKRIVPLERGVAFISEKGRVVIFQDDGVLLGESQLRSNRSIVTSQHDEILELSPEGQSIGCYRLLKNERIWQQKLPGGIQSMAVGHKGNRVAVLSEKTLHVLRLLDIAENKVDRNSYLEF
ncbi:MAG: PQQ-binding-like beta-propeller repeat protein [Candidatus Nitronauta litoralis]|uniref:PQQ-binding-like beta-propeller repeat protein n=1 Tax=Candidatus Nitronauta litoralis TaxID=2705533 RepID=A0A7T0FYV5_9BACT|nr:MAG: PQQ-binding-like beta-propeller repeat protein [Candidatus Nitronauta litoralis]